MMGKRSGSAQRSSVKSDRSSVAARSTGGLAHLGPEVLELLHKAGIRTRADLEELGSVGAYVAVSRKGLKPTLSLLYAVEGALRGVAWASLPYHVRASLTLEADAILHSERIR